MVRDAYPSVPVRASYQHGESQVGYALRTIALGEPQASLRLFPSTPARSLYDSLISLPWYRATMLAKLTSKNQLTLPKNVVAEVGGAEYFDVRTENGRIVLTPVGIQRADAVRAKLAELGITERDVADAVAWARARGR